MAIRAPDGANKTMDLRRRHEVAHVRHRIEHKGGAFLCEDCRESFAKAISLKTVLKQTQPQKFSVTTSIIISQCYTCGFG